MAAYTFKLRRGTAAQWTAANPILAAGEPGIEQDGNTSRFKMGDGVRHWNDPELSYYLTQDELYEYITNAVDTASPISQEKLDQILDQVEENLELPDLVLLWQNAKA